MRPRISQLAGSGATDGQAPVWDATSGLWLPKSVVRTINGTAPDAAGNVALSGVAHTIEDEGTALTQRGTLDFQGAGVTVTDDAANSKTVVTIPGGSGGGSSSGEGAAGYDIPPATPNAKDDEFFDAAGQSGPTNGLAAKWTKHNLATASYLDMTMAKGAAVFNLPGGLATDQGIYQAAPAGDFELNALGYSAGSGNRQMWGLFIVDTSGNGITIPVDSGDVVYVRDVAGWVVGTATSSISLGNYWSQFTSNSGVRFGLRKVGTTYYGSISPLDKMLPKNTTEVSLTSTITPAYIGFGRVYGTVDSKILLDYFRVS